jgi:hypothetical protein
MHLKFSEAPPWELLRWTLAENYGWTLEYIDALSVATIHQWIQIEDGKAKAFAPIGGGGHRARKGRNV